ncbi:hypothetical protein Cgig2_007562 [Carnegiea gigantea]|uniref:Zinc knuckle CX2CX4HX4C domain-containing protein n=1 Tax=Carnegiea gigantea TaxID=171969 RepID=A0A9Q1GPV3_9CARY|nr:hypothetical protein Cgig2_007562 [Carnegiea gigantea]
MATVLEEEWQNLSLTAKEEQVIIADDEDDSMTNELISLCLLGCLHTTFAFNPRALKSVLRNVWKPSKGLAFNGSIFLPQQMINLEVPSKVEFRIAYFWVKAYDVLGKKQTTSFAQVLASNIGTFVSCDEATMFGVDKALCFWVDINISKPLRRGIYIKIADKQLWIRFKYVKLSEFCYGYGTLGHVLINCDLISETKDEANLQYGAWLRASPLKLRHYNRCLRNESCIQLSRTRCNHPKLIYDFTWCNFQENGIVVKERLDRYCADTEWSLLFLNAFVSHINSDISYHLPILLKCHPRINKRSAQKRLLMFENIWFTEPACKDMVTATWFSTSHANAVDNLLSRLSKCSSELDHWNRTSFGNVSQQIRDLERRLKS